MNFDKEQSKKELAGAMEGILKEIRENGFKSFETSQDDDAQKEMIAAIYEAALDAVKNKCTKWRNLRRFLWECARDDAYDRGSESLLLELNAGLKETLNE